MAQGDRPGKKPFDPARAEQIKANIARGVKDVGAGIVKEEIFGIPGAFADLSGLAQFVTNPFTYGTSEKLQTASEDLIADLGASALAAKAGVELSDEIFDEEGNIRPEMVGRFLAPGALYAKSAALAPGIGRLFAQTTKTRGSGIEVKGSGAAELKASPSDLGPSASDEIMDYVRQQETPDAIRDLVSTGADEAATYFLQYSREGLFGEPLDTISADTLGAIQSKLKADSDVLVADHLGLKVEDLTPDTPVTVYRVGDVKEGEVQSFSLDPNIGQRQLPGQRLRERRGQEKQSTVEYTVKAGDILAAPESTVPALSRLNEREILIDGSNVKSTAPKKEVLEGEVVGTKSKKYMKLEKEMGEARTPELRAARELNMETQGVQDAFDLNAANNIDKNFEFASGGDDVRATSDEFIDGVIDEYQGARDQGFNRGDALVDAIRVKVRDYNEIYPNALNENSVLDDIAKNVNDDFGFDAALSRFREAQTNRNALEAELQTAKFKNVREAQEEATRVREEQLGIADLSDSEKAAFYRNMGEQEQRGIAGIGVPEPETPKPNLRLVKKAKGGPVDMRSGVGDLFRVYS